MKAKTVMVQRWPVPSEGHLILCDTANQAFWAAEGYRPLLCSWSVVSEARYNEMLEVLPPALWLAHGFLVGEPWDHDGEGRPRFQAFCRYNGVHYVCNNPMTAKAFRAIVPADFIAGN